MSDKVIEKFYFSYEFGDYGDADHLENRLTFNSNGATIHELLDKFEQFLRGSGFLFNGHLEIVDRDAIKTYK